MSAIVSAPREMFEEFAQFRLPTRADKRLQELMDRNNEGKLTATEREEMSVLAELSESLSLLRARALQLLGRKPV